jgi:nucleoside-diphosphate-sugar epimerase
MLDRSRVLVTGGAGFIGSHIVDRLTAEGLQVGVLDNFSTGDVLNLQSSSKHEITIHNQDIRDYDAVSKIVQEYQTVIHQAALVSVARSVEDPGLVNQVNVTGTLNLLRASVESKVERFVYASSSSVYGDTETLPKRESMNTVPSSPYGTSKLAGENYCRVFAKVYGLKTVSLR